MRQIPHPPWPRFLQTLALAILVPGLPTAAPAQVGPDLGDNSAAVLVGNISINPRKPSLIPVGSAAPRIPMMFVEGPVRFAATVYRQNPDTYRFTGDMPPQLGVDEGGRRDGTAKVKLGRYKITARQIVEAVLPDDIPASGQSLIWRSESRNISQGYKLVEEVGGLEEVVMSALQVGDLRTVPRRDAKNIIRLDFWGTDGGKSLLESGSYSAEPLPGFPPARIAGQRRGFISMDGYISDLRSLEDVLPRQPGWLRRAADFEPVQLSGLLTINRRIKEVSPRDFGPDSNLIGTPYETGRMSGRFFGFLD